MHSGLTHGVLPEFDFPILDELQPRVTESLESNPGHVFLNVCCHRDQGFQDRGQHPICVNINGILSKRSVAVPCSLFTTCVCVDVVGCSRDGCWARYRLFPVFRLRKNVFQCCQRKRPANVRHVLKVLLRRFLKNVFKGRIQFRTFLQEGCF